MPQFLRADLAFKPDLSIVFALSHVIFVHLKFFQKAFSQYYTRVCNNLELSSMSINYFEICVEGLPDQLRQIDWALVEVENSGLRLNECLHAALVLQDKVVSNFNHFCLLKINF